MCSEIKCVRFVHLFVTFSKCNLNIFIKACIMCTTVADKM